MFDGDKRNLAKMKPLLQRVLIADPNPHGARMLVDILREMARSYCWVATSTEQALKVAQTSDPQLVVVEVGGNQVDGLAITRTLRRSTWSARQAPVIAVTGAATAGSILAARDAGVHEFLRKPYNMKDLVRRLEAVTLRDRDWVEGIGYIGPDRRRFNSGEYSGSLKRRDDGSETPYQQKINQALRIVRAAVAASETDPQQAMRALLAQATTLQSVSKDFRITVAASEINKKLSRAVQSGQRLNRADAEQWAAPLLAFLTEDAGDAEAEAA